MNHAVCTLFEGNYHYGLAVLTNSLYRSGYRGDLYAGYKGALPQWIQSRAIPANLDWMGAVTYEVGAGLTLFCLPIESEYHLTNYKPFFMRQLFGLAGAALQGLVYFDPDIVVKCRWSFYETWLSHGVALVHEIISNDMPPSHPIRKEWHKVINAAGRSVTRNLYSYFNGGFCGVTRHTMEFLDAWIDITETAIRHFQLTPGQWKHDYDRTYIFYAQDQDTMNIAAMCSKADISEMGPEAMDFIHGGFTMSHSVGSPKPWNKHFLKSVSKGFAPSLTDKVFWLHADGPIQVYRPLAIKRKRIAIRLSSIISRFHNRH